MSPAFQETLIGNELLMNSHGVLGSDVVGGGVNLFLSAEIRYFDTITIKHVNTKNLLHSHPQRYPRDYPDKRISSQGQQVTGYPHEDENNNWIIIPTKALPETGRGRIVRHNDVIQLLHAQTDSFLVTHDVASPGFTTHQEFTTSPKDQMRHNETLFHLRLIDGYEGQVLTTKANHFKLQHAMTTVYMMLPGHELPDWAFNQQEVNGHRQPEPEGSEVWVGDEIVAGERVLQPSQILLLVLIAMFVDLDELDERLGNQKDRKPKSMNFFSRFIQLQDLMFAHNAGLTASHPYASSPSSWPFAKKGISFWTVNEGHKQIYFVGNLVGWWTAAGAVFLIFGIFPASIFAERRNIPVLTDCKLSGFKDRLCGTHFCVQPSPIVYGIHVASS